MLLKLRLSHVGPEGAGRRNINISWKGANGIYEGTEQKQFALCLGIFRIFANNDHSVDSTLDGNFRLSYESN